MIPVMSPGPLLIWKKSLEKGSVIMLFSPVLSTVRGNFVHRCRAGADFGRVTALCIGEKTEEEARKAGMVTYTARRADIESLVLLAEEMEKQ